jgi:uracil-DNA glycosylase
VLHPQWVTTRAGRVSTKRVDAQEVIDAADARPALPPVDRPADATVTATSAEPFVPERGGLRALAKAAADCRGCDLYEHATQTVFGAGPARAEVVLVGEQPGDVEDRQGAPFVGPAGRVLDRALAEAGIVRDRVYLTNAVKHFRWKAAARGKRRIHETPAARHVAACGPWLSAELAAIRPRGVVALGAIAAHALFGGNFRLTAHRGELLGWPPPRGPYGASVLPVRWAAATVHPSSILRVDPADREHAYLEFIRDLRVIAQELAPS